MIGLTPESSATTDSDRVARVRQIWDVADLTDDAISSTLSTSYRGIPYKEWVDHLFTVYDVQAALNARDYNQAAQIVVNFGFKQGVNALIEDTIFASVFGVARLAAWPIEQGLNAFADAVVKKAYTRQLVLYRALRDAGNTHEAIVALEPADLLDAPGINGGLVTKTDQRWLTAGFLNAFAGYPSSPLTPALFFDQAQIDYDFFTVKIAQLSSDSAHLKALFTQAARPAAPLVTVHPHGQTIDAGQSITLSVTATGTAPLIYLWRKDGVTQSGVNAPSLLVSAAGDYLVEVSNAFGKDVSDTATIVVRSAQSISLTAPAAGVTVANVVTVRATAPDATKVEFFLDGVKMSTDSSPPFTWSWDTAGAIDGSHALTAKAYNGAAILGTSSTVTVTIDNTTTFTDADEHEPNDSSLKSTSLVSGAAASGRVSSPTDVDWFKVNVTTAGTLTFNLTVPTGKDYDLELFGPDALYIKGSYADTGVAENISYNATTTGTYYVRVYGYPVGNGSFSTTAAYSLTVNVPPAGQFSQQGPKLVGTGVVGIAQQGLSVSLSADGNTAIVGGQADNSNVGAAWVWKRSGGNWTQQGTKLIGSGAVGSAFQGRSVSLSADGDTAIVGGVGDNGLVGAAWVWTQIGGVWTQQGSKLVGSGGVGYQGQSVSLSADGNTALVGGVGDNGGAGATWVWMRSGGVWTQQGTKLVGSGAVGNAGQGQSVSLSADGNTAIIGGQADNNYAGAAWVWTRSGGVWTQQGSKLVGSGTEGTNGAQQGFSVSLSADGNTAIVGGNFDNGYVGAAWVWTRSGGVWTQQGTKLVGSGSVGNSLQGASVSLSADGNTAIISGEGDSSGVGAVWVWTRSGGVWIQQGTKLIGSGAVGNAVQGYSVFLSADGTTAIVGGYNDNSSAGAVWVFAASDPAVPTITTPPQNQSVPWGASASLSVAATNSTNSVLSYQWRRNGADVPGAALPTYVTPPTTMSQNGDSFTVRITTEFGSTTSAAVILTVTDPPEIRWTGAVSNDWNVAGNWDLARVPTASDVVRIASGTVSATGLVGSYILISGGTLTWTSGALRAQLVNAAGGVLVLAGTSDKIFQNNGTQVFNEGLIRWSGTGKLITAGDVFYGHIPIENLAGGIWEISSDAETAPSGNYPPTFIVTNRGTIRKTGGQGVTVFGQTSFTNYGTVEVQAGTLAFTTGFTNNGGFTVAAGATLRFAGGTYFFNAGSTLNAATGGIIDYQNGYFTFASGASVTGTTVNRVTGNMSLTGTVNLPNFELAGGTLSGAFTNTGTLTWTSGALRGALTNGAGGVLVLAGLANKTFETGPNRAQLFNEGIIRWSGAGKLIAAGDVFYGHIPIENLAGGIWEISSDSETAPSGNYPPTFIVTNRGTIRKTGGQGVTTFGQTSFTNYGRVEMEAGTLAFTTGFTNNGGFIVAAGATLRFAGGSFLFNASSTLNAASGGTIDYQNGYFTFDSGATVTGTTINRVTGNVSLSGTVNLPNFELAGGTLSGTFTNTGTLTWTSGTLRGQLSNGVGGVLVLAGSGNKIFETGPNRAQLSNEGIVRWSGAGKLIAAGDNFYGHIPIENLAGGIWEISSDSETAPSGNYPPTFIVTNRGTVRKTGGQGVTTFAQTSFTNYGTVDVQAGTLAFTASFTNTGFVLIGSSGKATVNGTTLTAAAITTQPIGQTVNSGADVTFTVAATGTAPLTYQWRKGGVARSGATSASLTLTNVQPADSGSYDVVVSNGVSPNAISAPAVLNVVPTGVSATHSTGSFLANGTGGTVSISNRFTYAGAVTNLRWSVLLPTGWSFASSDASGTDLQPVSGATSLLEWRWSTLPPSPVTFTYSLNVPATDIAPQPIAALVSFSYQGTPIQMTAKPDPLMVGPWHSADTDGNGRISLLELTRVIELYNTRLGTTRTGRYKVQAGSEDGFAADLVSTANQTLSAYHSADSDHSGQITLVELTRVIELYNYRVGTVRTGQYHAQASPPTEDGFAPGP